MWNSEIQKNITNLFAERFTASELERHEVLRSAFSLEDPTNPTRKAWLSRISPRKMRIFHGDGYVAYRDVIAGWWFGRWLFCSPCLGNGIIIPTDEVHFSEGLKPPTRLGYNGIYHQHPPTRCDLFLWVGTWGIPPANSNGAMMITFFWQPPNHWAAKVGVALRTFEKIWRTTVLSHWFDG